MALFILLALPALILVFTSYRMPRLALVLSAYLATASIPSGGYIPIAAGIALVLLLVLPNAVRKRLGLFTVLTAFLYAPSFLSTSPWLSLATLILALPSIWVPKYRAILTVALSSLFLSLELSRMYYLEVWITAVLALLFTVLGIVLCPIREKKASL